MTDIDLDAVRCSNCGTPHHPPSEGRGQRREFPRCPACLIPAQRSEEYGLALAVTTYRLAIESATALLRMGRDVEALEVLEQAGAPTR